VHLFCKWAICGLILGTSALLHAQSLAIPTTFSMPKVSFSCPRPTTSRSAASLFTTHPKWSPGLNIDFSCLPQRRFEFLRWEPWQPLVEVPVKSGSPMLCGIAYDHGIPIRVCTRG
jgi:hypothetical protein